MTQHTRRWNDGASACVRTVWFNGKQWHVSDFRNGRTLASVFATAEQRFPRVFGTHLAAR